MVFRISKNDITVIHTEVSNQLEGRGVDKQLVAAMADYARKNQMKVIPLCPFVFEKFKSHAEEYANVWNK